MKTELQDYISALNTEFEKNSNSEIAQQQSAYLRNKFSFYGIKGPDRRDIQKPFLQKNYLPPQSEMSEYVSALWALPQREYQMFALDFMHKYVKALQQKDIELFEIIITTKSWWDTVDFIAVTMLGAYFMKFQELRDHYVDKWLDSDNLWLQRSALLFQLKYKDKLDTHLLARTIHPLLGSKEFFINKAIGWVLRHYSRTNPNWVIQFVQNTPSLSGLSQREALRLIK